MNLILVLVENILIISLLQKDVMVIFDIFFILNVNDIKYIDSSFVLM